MIPMESEMSAPPRPSLRLKRGAFLFYCASFIVITALTILGLLFDDMGEALVGLPMLIILGLTIFTDRKDIHVPPAMIVMVITAFFLAMVGRWLSEDGILYALANFLTGVNLGLLGLILIYILLRSMPGIRDEDRRVVAFIAICISIASYSMIRMVQYFITIILSNNPNFDIGIMMGDMLLILVGSLVVSCIYAIQTENNVFGGILNSFLEENSEAIGMDGMEREEILRIIEEGESEKVEFKSTLRTNLQTGETDKRMEKAVTKTIVAFLNSNGGNLLIGVADDGSIIGSDVGSFDNKDKMGLHLSNLLSSQIGAQFLPYINFFMVDFEDKTVIRVKCTSCPKPVFLKEGKTEIFFVRKGPQSDELTGMSLINYVNNRKNDKGKSKRFS